MSEDSVNVVIEHINGRLDHLKKRKVYETYRIKNADLPTDCAYIAEHANILDCIVARIRELEAVLKVIRTLQETEQADAEKSN